MHRSRLSAIIIDCNESGYAQGVEFWSRALGREPDPGQEPDERYTRLVDRPGQLRVEVQRLSEPSAYHLDIETDDVEAEVARLEKLGAVRKYKIKTWWVMRAPTGHDFCVIRPQTKSLASDPGTTAWED
ncbi:MAG TPA: VOC family protein [Kofleriaceae bacterium]|nr:VOC family protein [Kofleriaceae bacterium]